jgi:hypothetical protein
MNSADDLYEAVMALPASDRLRLVERLLRDLAAASTAPRPKWMDLEGAAPALLEGEDAQAWTSRTRAESDEARDAALGVPR